MKQKILGRTYNIKYVNKMEGNYVGRTFNLKQEMELLRTHKEFQDQTYWHEIIHVIDGLITIKDGGKALSESEVDRLAYAISAHLRELKR